MYYNKNLNYLIIQPYIYDGNKLPYKFLLFYQNILKEEDVQFLSDSAYADACRPGNPRDTSVEEIKALYHSMM